MAETVKKTKTTAKDSAKSNKKAAAPADTSGASSNVTEITDRPRKKPVTQSQVRHDQIAQLAHRFWTERGGQHGHHEEDWYRAEQELRAQQELRGKAS
jgi:hypothetical protein